VVELMITNKQSKKELKFLMMKQHLLFKLMERLVKSLQLTLWILSKKYQQMLNNSLIHSAFHQRKKEMMEQF